MAKKYSGLMSLCTLAAVLLSAEATLSRAFADDAETQGKNAVEDAKTATSKTVRKGKKIVRKATGTDSTAKDVHDSVDDSKNDAENAANKAKNRENQ